MPAGAAGSEVPGAVVPRQLRTSQAHLRISALVHPVGPLQEIHSLSQCGLEGARGGRAGGGATTAIGQSSASRGVVPRGV